MITIIIRNLFLFFEHAIEAIIDWLKWIYWNIIEYIHILYDPVDIISFVSYCYR